MKKVDGIVSGMSHLNRSRWLSFIVAAGLGLGPAIALGVENDLEESMHRDVPVEIRSETPERVQAAPRENPPPRHAPSNPTPQIAGEVQAPGTFGLSFGLPFIDLGAILDLFGDRMVVPTVGGSLFLTETAALRVEVGLGLMLEPRTDFAFVAGAGYRNYHRGLSRRVAPYYEPGGSFGWGNNTLFLHGYFDYGVEYFFNDQLSLGGALGIQLNLVDGLDVIHFVTGRSLVELTVYW